MTTQQQEIILYNPFDSHTHWRRGQLLRTVAKYTRRQFSGSLLMPNTDPHLITFDRLIAYRQEVSRDCDNENFLPIFTMYLAPELSIEEMVEAWRNKLIDGVKYYPKGGTTGSDKGISGFRGVRHILTVMQREKIPLLVHGEVPEIDGEVVDDFDREEVFMKNELTDLVKEFPGLRIVLEHITTEEAVQFVLSHENIRATITPQHLLFDRRALYNGVKIDGQFYKFDINKNGGNPAFLCRPILKRLRHVLALRRALLLQAKDGLRKFGLGSDTAPHIPEKKYCECGSCGVYSAPICLELYAMVFAEIGILDHLQTFACDIMPEFYGIKYKLPHKMVVLSRKPQLVQYEYEGIVTPFAGLAIPWTAIAV